MPLDPDGNYYADLPDPPLGGIVAVGTNDVRSADYGGVAPAWTPTSGTGIAFDTSTGAQDNYYDGQWHF